jgi:hypothetical protein
MAPRPAGIQHVVAQVRRRGFMPRSHVGRLCEKSRDRYNERNPVGVPVT